MNSLEFGSYQDDNTFYAPHPALERKLTPETRLHLGKFVLVTPGMREFLHESDALPEIQE